jgi:HEAT repeat protein
MSASVLLLALLQYNYCPPPPTPTTFPPLTVDPPGLAGANTPRLASPADAGPSTPTPSFAGPSTPTLGPTRGPGTGGVELGPDLDWRDWWWLNGYVYLKPLERQVPITPQGDDLRVPFDASASSFQVERAAATASLRAALRDGDVRVRSTAALSAGRLGEEAFRVDLLALLEDTNPLVRLGAIAGLGLLGQEEAVPPLLRLGIGDAGPLSERATAEERDLALLALGLASTRGTTPRFALPLRAFLGGSSTNDLRLFGASTAASLALAGDGLAFDRLGAIARDRHADPALRARALWAFRAAELDSRREVVLASLDDSNVEVRRAAALALGRLGGGDGETVVEALRSACEKDGDVAVRAFSILSLGEVGGEVAKRELLHRLVRGKKLFRPWAAIGAGILARPSADPEVGLALARALEGEKNRDTRAAIALAVGLSRTPNGREGVRRLVLEGENARERVFAALAVALGEDEEGRANLCRAIREIPNTAVRTSDGLALAVFRDPDDAAILVETFESSEPLDSVATAALALAWNGSRLALERLRREIETSPRAERRAAAALALGFAFSPDKVPSSIAATAGWNYMASAEAAHTAARIWM